MRYHFFFFFSTVFIVSIMKRCTGICDTTDTIFSQSFFLLYIQIHLLHNFFFSFVIEIWIHCTWKIVCLFLYQVKGDVDLVLSIYTRKKKRKKKKTYIEDYSYIRDVKMIYRILFSYQYNIIYVYIYIEW